MQAVASDPEEMDIKLFHDGKDIFFISGWPQMNWHFQSVEGDAEANLDFSLRNVTGLPDCILPHCVFSMWETMSEVKRFVRFKDQKTEVTGKVFFDHPRIINQRNEMIPRHRYFYTTMYLEDGSGIFSYHAEGFCHSPIGTRRHSLRTDKGKPENT
jgi:hypothetical protein